ncbi:hypothetical protein LSAT2_009356 [Lamellibrachia satsuma]|nr:hypothetical protein LSAT2_009356 [Lamellibrachia satsuma]
MCTTRRAYSTMALIGVCALVKNSCTFWIAGFIVSQNGLKVCNMLYDTANPLHVIYMWFEVSVSSLLPFLLLVFFSVHILRQLYNHSATVGVAMPFAMITQQRNRRMATMLIMMSALFIFFTLPKKLVNLLQDDLAAHGDDARNKAIFILVQSVAHKLWYASSAVNVWIYIAFNVHFRRDVARVFCRRPVAVQPYDVG